jgi:hypothetical protein
MCSSTGIESSVDESDLDILPSEIRDELVEEIGLDLAALDLSFDDIREVMFGECCEN